MQNRKFETLISTLPPIAKTQLRHELDYYGFSQILAKKVNRHKVPFPLIASWKHGWTPQHTVVSPKQIAHWGNPSETCIVSNKWQKALLEKHSYSQVKVGGIPFCYAPTLNPQRIKNSLLVMPVHSLSHIDLQGSFSDFFYEISKMKKDFELMVVCLHQESATESILKLLTDLKIPYVLGASAHDANSLIRMKMLFESFENMITNHLGSHVPYFNLCGGKSQIIEPYFELSREIYLQHPWYKSNEELIDAALQNTYSNVQKHYSFLTTALDSQSNHYSWAASELGQDHILDNTDLEFVLGWSYFGKLFYLPKKPRQTISTLRPSKFLDLI